PVSLELIARNLASAKPKVKPRPRRAPWHGGPWAPRGWGSAPRIQGGAEQFSGHLDDRNDAFGGHSRRTKDPEHPDPGLAGRVRGRDHAAVIEDLVAGLVADEDLHAFRLQAVVEQVQEIALLVEGLEQAAQLLDAGELGHAHEVGLPLDHV